MLLIQYCEKKPLKTDIIPHNVVVLHKLHHILLLLLQSYPQFSPHLLSLHYIRLNVSLPANNSADYRHAKH